jgi:Xaa-Pro aminopeptidase
VGAGFERWWHDSLLEHGGAVNVPLREGMTMTIGHTILAIPGLGGVRHEDVYRVTPTRGELLRPYPIDPAVAG